MWIEFAVNQNRLRTFNGIKHYAGYIMTFSHKSIPAKSGYSSIEDSLPHKADKPDPKIGVSPMIIFMLAFASSYLAVLVKVSISGWCSHDSIISSDFKFL